MDTQKLIEQIKDNPDLLYKISGREFEEIIAEILGSFGWDVKLSKQSRDGGVDIFSTTKDQSGIETSWIVECKRYKQDTKVGIEQVLQMDFLKSSFKVSNGILITTSTFTKGAREYAKSRYDIKLLDHNIIYEWISTYKPPSVERKTYVDNKNFYSCFISYSHKDQEFTELLYSELRKNSIAVWYAPEDLKAGKKIHEEVSSAINIFDKLLIVLSENSIKSEWVHSEIRKAKKRELTEGVRVLFPISLVSYDTLKNWELFDADSGKDLAVELREYYIPDFSSWKDSLSFEKSLRDLLRGLNSE